MKKLLILLALCMVFSVVMVACDPAEQTPEDTTAGTTEAPEVTTPEDTTVEDTTVEDTTVEDTTVEDTTVEDTTTEETTEPEPQPDPVTTHVSFDECDPWIGETQGTGFFTPGQSASWDKIALVEDYSVQFIRVWGWAGFFAETVGEFGYQIGDAEPVYSADFAWETGDDVKNAAAAGGAKSASRFKIMIPVEFVGGEVTIKALVKDAVGTVEVITEFTLNKTPNPNAPVFFVTAGEMASSIPGSPDVASAEMSADGNYITITTGTVGDPYYQLPMVNGKGYQAGFIAIKYRTTVQEIGGQIFIGSGAGPNGQGDNPTFDYVADGKWHVAIIPLEGVASITDAGINYLRWDMFQRGTENVIDMGYIAAFQTAEAALAYDALFAGNFIDILNVAQDNWTVSGHKQGVTSADDATHGGMVAAGGIATGALLHQGSVGIGELNLAQFSKMIVYMGIDNSQVTLDHHAANAANRIMITNADVNMVMSPADDQIVASIDYAPSGWALTAFEIDLTGVDYNGPVYVTYDTLPGTFMLIGAIELVYDADYVEPEVPEGDPYYALKMTQAQEGVDYYFTGAMAGEYLATSTNVADAAKVFVETHEEGLRQYVLVDGVKNYIELHFNASNKVRVCMTTEPTQYYVFNEEANTYVINFNDNNYYLGTYNAFTTIGCSTTYYITGDNAANVGVSQYVAQWVEYAA